jgi:hypothetical protein
LGKSAFTGAHRLNPDRNALAQFLKLVEQGKVPRGGFLLIENLDRLSREHIQPALLLVLNLLQAGLRIVQLKPVEMIFDDKSDTLPVMMMMMELSRGHSESAIKSERIGGAWQEKKRRVRDGVTQKETTRMGKDRKILTRRLPAWVKEQDGELVAIPKRAETIKFIFHLSAGGYGGQQIVKRLTEDKIEPFGPSGRWTRTYIREILTDKRVLGIYTPRKRKGGTDGDPVPGYFPIVIGADLFDVVGRQIQERSQQGTRVGKYIHLFSGLLKNARDGQGYHAGTMTRPGRQHQRILLNDSAQGQGGHWSFPLAHFEGAVLTLLKEVDVHAILNGDDGPDESLALAAELARLQGRKAELEKAMLEGEKTVASAYKVLAQLEERETALAAQLAEARAKASHPLSASWGEVQTLAEALQSAPDQEDFRLRLRAELRHILESVWLLVVGRGRFRLCACQAWFRAGQRLRQRSFLILSWPATSNGRATKPGGWWARSFADAALPGSLDLRKQDHVKRLEKALMEVELGA